MLESIQAKLEASRKELLDLGLKNPLLNYRTPKGKGLKIVQEKFEFVFDILAKQNKAMTFLDIQDKKDGLKLNEDSEEDTDLPELGQHTDESYQDTKLQTTEVEQKLQTRKLLLLGFHLKGDVVGNLYLATSKVIGFLMPQKFAISLGKC